ncbi:MAG: histidinol-phosphate transaminase [Lachnospiraceae bacterium]|nr:histidinol-phosphate transaminase [Lachnospiraceae bacterium]
MSTSWEANVRKVIPYVPGEQPKIPNLVKLNTNENPYPPSPAVRKALEEMNADELRLYPDPAAEALVEAFAEVYGLKKNQVFTGVGSDDVLAMSFLAFFNSDQPILFPDITYSFYDVWADLFRIPYKQIPLDENFQIRTEDYAVRNGGVIFPNPNAPTGVFLEREQARSIIEANRDVVVIVDEAYIDFGGESVIDMIDTYDNLLVVQTLSKSRSLAGMRIGAAFGNEKLIAYLNDVKYSINSYTMNRTAIAAGRAALLDTDYFRETTEKVIRTREWTKVQLRELGFEFGDSMSNFIFARHQSVPAEELFTALRKAGIIVRYFKKPRIDQYLRISIGTDEQMRKLIGFLKEYLA